MPTGHTEHLLRRGTTTGTIFLKWGPLGRDDNQEAIEFFATLEESFRVPINRGCGTQWLLLPVTAASAASTFGPHTKVLERWE